MNMDSSPVLYQRLGHVASITLNRPDSGNRIDEILAAGLRDACRRALEDDEAYVVLITGTGAVFSAGAAGLPGDAAALEEAMSRRRVADALSAIPKPTIGAINGDAIGQGLELALACDLRIAAEGARLALDQVRHGLIPWDGGTQRLPRLIARGVAVDMILTGRSIDAVEARDAGLVSEVLPGASVPQRGKELADRLASMAPIAAGYVKEAVHKGMDMPLDQAIRLEADLALLLHTTRDRAEGIQAFLQRRRSEFRGT